MTAPTSPTPRPTPAGRGRGAGASGAAGAAGVPLPLLLPALVGLAFLVLPLVGLLVRAPWRTLPRAADQPEVLAGAAAVAV